MLAKKLKLRVQDRQPTMGVLLSFDFWPGQLEMFKAEGLHFAVLDMEHSSCDLRTAEELCRTARLLDFPLLIRPEASVHYLVKKYVDMGAAGLMMPWMETEQQVNTLRDAVFTPPRGRRGPGGPSIFANRSLDRAGWDEIESSLFLLIQIESREGLAAVRTLAQCDWIDATMLGPYDLSLNLSQWGLMDHPDVVAAIRQVREASESVSKPCGMVVGTPELAARYIGEGFPLILIPDASYLARLQLRAFLECAKTNESPG